ncbi:unnamed protein product [Sphagnum jensenii]|uniref:Uncharacterized protein n=1 Tax=Sphagnum jensenii TaxID=128206 RepID=A0ABP1ATC1_9BRYO
MLTLRRESCGQDFCRRSSSSSSSVTDTRSVGFFNRRVDDRYAAGIGNDSIGKELFVTGIFPCQEEHGRRSSSKLLLGFLQLLSRRTDECCWMSKRGV